MQSIKFYKKYDTHLAKLGIIGLIIQFAQGDLNADFGMF